MRSTLSPVFAEAEMVQFLRLFFEMLPASFAFHKNEAPFLYGDLTGDDLHLTAHIAAQALMLQMRQPLRDMLAENPKFICNLISEMLGGEP
jgi:hypothetical protein